MIFSKIMCLSLPGLATVQVGVIVTEAQRAVAGTAGATSAPKPKVLFYKGLGKHFPNHTVRNRVLELIEAGETNPFHVTDQNQVQRQVQWWKDTMRGIHPHYAVKSNNSDAILSMLAQCGSDFDCASESEMKQVLKLGVSPNRIVFSNPCKMQSDLLFAKQNGINSTVFDSSTELDKIKQYHPSADLMIRIYANDPSAGISLDEKAGAHRAIWKSLLAKAKRLGLKVRGVMFHIGTGSKKDNSAAYAQALNDTKELFAMGKIYGFQMDTVDIGGGQSEAYGAQIAATVAAHRSSFPAETRWYGEPGRCFCKPTQTVACKVIGLKECGSGFAVTLNDGVHGSFSGVMQEKTYLCPDYPVGKNGSPYPAEFRKRHVFGPTCDGLDKLTENTEGIPVPNDIKVGDWLVFASMGAYSQVTRSRFNGMTPSVEKVLGLTQSPLVKRLSDSENQ